MIREHLLDFLCVCLQPISLLACNKILAMLCLAQFSEAGFCLLPVYPLLFCVSSRPLSFVYRLNYLAMMDIWVSLRVATWCLVVLNCVRVCYSKSLFWPRFTSAFWKQANSSDLYFMSRLPLLLGLMSIFSLLFVILSFYRVVTWTWSYNMLTTPGSVVTVVDSRALNVCYGFIIAYILYLLITYQLGSCTTVSLNNLLNFIPQPGAIPSNGQTCPRK
jgi:hypothetical protein